MFVHSAQGWQVTFLEEWSMCGVHGSVSCIFDLQLVKRLIQEIKVSYSMVSTHAILGSN